MRKTNCFRPRCALPILLAAVLLAGCTSHKVTIAPVEVKPIHITIDVHVRVERALDDFFGDLDKQSSTLQTPAETGGK